MGNQGIQGSWFSDAGPPPASSPKVNNENESTELQTSVEDTQAAVTSLSVRRKAIQDAFAEGGDLMDVKRRAILIFAKYGIPEWSKDDDSFLTKLIRGYRTKADEFPDERPRSLSPEFPPGVPMSTCIVMLDEYPENQGIKCEAGHFISQMALNHYIKTENGKEFDEIYARKGKILCPRVIMGECTSEPYRDVMVARMVDVDVFEHYMKQTKRCLYQEAFEEISAKVEMLQKKNNILETEMMEEQVRLQFKKDDGTFGGFMCPDCKFGPIDHRDCNDLRTHHDQQVGNAVINNGCPVCGFFTPILRNWLQWDGTFLRINDAQREALCVKWKLNREEKAQLDAVIQQITQRLTPLAAAWAAMRSQLVSRVNELCSRSEFLLVYVSRLSTRLNSSLDMSMGKEAYEKTLAKRDEPVKMVEDFIAHLQNQIEDIKNSELWKVGEVNNDIVKAMNLYREAVLKEEEEPVRRAKFVETMDKIKALSGDVDRYASFLSMVPATSALADVSGKRVRSHQKTISIIGKLRKMIDEEADGLVKVVEDAYGSFLSGFDTESDSEATSPVTPELSENHELDENGEIIPMGAETWNLKPPTMTVQESREKSHALRENIENYESKYDEIQSIYVEYLMEDGKLESEEHAKFLEHFERNFLGEEVIQEPDLEEFLAYLKKREEDEQPRTESRMEKLMKMRTELELEIVRAHHPEADACEAVIVVRKYIGLTDVNGTYLLQTGFVNDRLHYRNDDNGSEIQWSTEWQYDLEGKKKEFATEYGAWVVRNPRHRVAIALSDDVPNPTMSKGKWTFRNGWGAVVPDQRVEVEYGLVYLQKSEEGREENVENVEAKFSLCSY